MSWDARRILREIADAGRRRKILQAFWRHADPAARALAVAQLAKAVHFRDETIRKMPADKKTDLLASRTNAAEFEQTFETALMQYHTHEASELMAAFLDRWGIPHVRGTIETDNYTPPSAEAIRSAARELSSRFDSRDVALYLASAGLLMGWEGVWGVVEEMKFQFSSALTN